MSYDLRLCWQTCLIVLALQAVGFSKEYDVDYRTDIEYGRGGDEKLLMDLATPGGLDKPSPAIVLIHGGGWAAGDKKDFKDLARSIAKQGYTTVTINYRLAPKHHFPAQVEDCKCAVRYLREHAGIMKIDGDKIGAFGASAGAHLAMMLGVLDPKDGMEGEGGWAKHSSKVQAVTALFGPTDLMRDFPNSSDGIVKNFIGGTKQDKAEEYRQASPINYVDSKDAAMLLLQGTNDELVPFNQATLMAEAMAKAGMRGRVELLLGLGHGWGPPELLRTERDPVEFFRLYLGR